MHSTGHLEYLQDRVERFSANQSAAVKARIYGNRLRYADYGSPAVAAPMPPKPQPVPANPVEPALVIAPEIAPRPSQHTPFTGIFPPGFAKPDKIVRDKPISLCAEAQRPVDAVLIAVASAFGTPVDKIRGLRGPQWVGLARKAAYLIIRQELRYSAPLIARLLNRERTVIADGLRRAVLLHDYHPAWRQRYDDALASLGKRVA